MEFNNILVLCTGNICRSPMAAAVLGQEMTARGRNKANIASAGIAAAVGHGAPEHARALMAERGLDISGHRAIQLIPDSLLQMDLVLVMEKTQQQAVEKLQPAARGRVFRLGEWGDFDIPDPYRQNMDVYRNILSMIDRGLSDWMERIN